MSDTPPMATARPLPGSRDRTPELTTKREKRHRDDDDDDRDRHGRSHRHRDERSDRDRERERERDREPDERRRDRDRDDRDPRDDRRDREQRSRRHDDEDDEEREERRRRRRERERAERGDDEPRHRDERERRRERDDYGRDRSRDRSRRAESRSSRDDRDRREPPRERERERERTSSPRARIRDMTREEKERERERRDREMMEERREAARRNGYEDAPRRRRSPDRDPVNQLLNDVDSEARSIFVSQLAASLNSSDLGLFFEDKLGRGAVRYARILSDKSSRRSKGIGYVELATVELVNKALALSGTVVMGIPISINLTEAERNRTGLDIHALLASMTGGRDRRGGDRDGPRRFRFPPLSTGLALPHGLDPDAHSGASIPYHRLYITNISDSLTKDDLQQVFEPFGEVEFVDLHTDYSGHSKGTAYVQYRNLSSAEMALDALQGFDLAGRKIRAQTVEERQANHDTMIEDTGRGGRLDAAGRQQLMYKLARTEMPGATASSRPSAPAPAPKNPLMRPTHFLIVSNMFNPDEETERNWDLDLAEDVKGEVESKYGNVSRVKVDKMSQGDVYLEFKDIDSAERALKGLSGRFFGGKRLEAQYISETLFKAHL